MNLDNPRQHDDLDHSHGCYCYNTVHRFMNKNAIILRLLSMQTLLYQSLLHKGNWQEGSEQDNEINLERLIVQQKGFPVALAIVIHITERLLFSRCVD